MALITSIRQWVGCPVRVSGSLVVSDDHCVADVGKWAEGLDEIGELIGHRFVRSEPRDNAMGYVRRTAVGRGTQELLDPVRTFRARDLGRHATLAPPPTGTRAVRDDLFSYVKRHLGDPDGVLIIDETGFLKKGAGVARQYSGSRCSLVATFEVLAWGQDEDVCCPEE